MPWLQSREVITVLAFSLRIAAKHMMHAVIVSDRFTGLFSFNSHSLLVCVSFTIIGQPRNSVFIRRL